MEYQKFQVSLYLVGFIIKKSVPYIIIVMAVPTSRIAKSHSTTTFIVLLFR